MRNLDAVWLDKEFGKICDEVLTATSMMIDADKIPAYIKTVEAYGKRYHQIGDLLFAYSKAVKNNAPAVTLATLGVTLNILVAMSARFESGKFKIAP